MAIHHDYYDDWQGKEFTCQCGWKGPVGRGDLDIYEALGDFDCPSCDTKLLIVSWPTPGDIKKAADAGNADAQKQLIEMQKLSEDS